MYNNIQTFNFNNNDVRVINIDGEPWFVAKDICTVLGISKYRDAISSLDNDERGSVKVDTLGGIQSMTTINESGLYNLIFRSYKTEAKSFRRWVTHEVLPQIRKHGIFLSDNVIENFKNDPNSLEKITQLYIAEKEHNSQLKKQLQEEKQFSTLGRIVISLQGAVTVQDAAHFLAQHGIDIGQNRLYKRCRNDGWLCSRKGS